MGFSERSRRRLMMASASSSVTQSGPDSSARSWAVRLVWSAGIPSRAGRACRTASSGFRRLRGLAFDSALRAVLHPVCSLSIWVALRMVKLDCDSDSGHGRPPKPGRRRFVRGANRGQTANCKGGNWCQSPVCTLPFQCLNRRYRSVVVMEGWPKLKRRATAI